MDLLYEDPFDVEAQKKIEAAIHQANERVWQVLTPVSTDMLRHIFNGFGNRLIRAKTYQDTFLGLFGLWPESNGVSEVEKLAQTVRELEEAALAGGAAANAVRDYERKLQEMNEEKKVLDRELDRAKLSANRVAAVVANDWKDTDNKVMPVRQWLEERRVFQGEMQHLKENLTVAERTAKAEAQLKEKYQLRFKVLEERFKLSSRTGVSYAGPERTMSTGRAPRQSLGGVENLSRSSSSRFSSRNLPKSGIISSKVYGSSKLADLGHADEKDKTKPEDFVFGMLYDMLQKEVLTLQKACHQKDQNIKDKDNTIEALARR
nr:microtubule-associated protein 70-2-like [Tanacetum cinerariifolium]